MNFACWLLKLLFPLHWQGTSFFGPALWGFQNTVLPLLGPSPFQHSQNMCRVKCVCVCVCVGGCWLGPHPKEAASGQNYHREVRSLAGWGREGCNPDVRTAGLVTPLGQVAGAGGLAWPGGKALWGEEGPEHMQGLAEQREVLQGFLPPASLDTLGLLTSQKFPVTLRLLEWV